jgi:natural product biosynthesis luciferase-like monooxygenase protein
MRNVEEQSTRRLTYPLSQGQRALWFLQQLSPENAAYNVMLAATIRSSLDVPSLHRAWQLLAERHPSLRITVAVEDGGPRQRVHENLPVHFERVDASRMSADELKRRIVEEAHKPFDLERGPMTRLHLFSVSDQEHVILLTLHHMIIDSRSLVVLMDELGQLYGAAKRGEQAQLPALDLQYADYVEWQAGILGEGPEREKLWDYWRKELGGELPDLALPTDHARPRAQTFNGATRRHKLDGELSRQLKSLAEREGVSLYVLCLAAFQVLLHRYSGQQTILVGATATGRSLPGLEGVVGFFHNSIILRADLSTAPTFQDFLRQVERTVATALEHQEYPFPLLVEQLQPVRDPSRSPLFQVMFGMYRLGEQGVLPLLMSETGTRIELGELELESYALEQRVAMLDLTLTVIDVGESLSASLQYNSDLFEASTIERMLRHFETLLKGIVANPAERVGRLPLLGEGERERLLLEWNGDGAAEQQSPTERCVHELFEEAAGRLAQAVAVADGSEQLTYEELNRRANRLARCLQNRGVGPEVRVAVLMNRSAEMLVALLGVLKAGGAFVALHASASPELTAKIVEESQAKLLLTEGRLAKGLLHAHGVERLVLDEEREEIARQSDENQPSGAVAENLAMVSYGVNYGASYGVSYGVSHGAEAEGRPSGIMVEHRSLFNLWAAIAERCDDEEQAVWNGTPAPSISLSAVEALWVVAHGCCLRFDVEDDRSAFVARSETPATARGMEFSLFYFASGDTEGEVNKYQLMLDGARFADEHNFTAVWTPERHFHPFGGLYPNPSLTSAAIAAITRRIQIRAGSVVLPLHNPVRVAEEWSVVDNLSQGRVGLSVASGWHVNDFVVFAPDNHEERKEIMFRGVETIRQLWRGEAVLFQGRGGNRVEVKLFPRPVQPELPIWVTAFGSPDTFRMAGEVGGGVLTHLQGQSLEVLEEKIGVYRRAWREHGHEGAGHVTLMLHTFVGRDLEEVRETVRGPLRDYLKSSLDLIENLVESAGVEIDARHFTEENMEALLSHAFNRYFETSGLFGTPDSCRPMIARLKSIGVDEVACLVDFGVEHEAVMSGLHYLDVLRERSNSKVYAVRGRRSPFAEVAPHAKAPEREAPQPDAALALHGPVLFDGQVDRPQTFPLPVAKSMLFVLDAELQPVAQGITGELYLGGSILARGFQGRAGLTAEHFIPHPFGERGGERLYRTGALARYRSDGRLELVGPAARKAEQHQRGQHTSAGQAQVGPHAEEADIGPRTEMERVIAGVWQELLGVDRVSVHDNFFDLGGNASLLDQAHGYLQRRLARDIAVVELFQYPTVSTLARHLSARAAEPPSAVVAESRTRAETRLAAQRQLRQNRALGRRPGAD